MSKPIIALNLAHTIIPYVCWCISDVSEIILPSLKQIFMQLCRSLTSFILTIGKICQEVRTHINYFQLL